MGNKPAIRTSVCTRRWTAVNKSAYRHERDALERIRAAIPDTDPWRAWTNFSFATATGRLFEVDLLITAPGGLHLVELKSWRGRLTATESGWVQTNESNEQIAHGRPAAAGLAQKHGTHPAFGRGRQARGGAADPVPEQRSARGRTAGQRSPAHAVGRFAGEAAVPPDAHRVSPHDPAPRRRYRARTGLSGNRAARTAATDRMAWRRTGPRIRGNHVETNKVPQAVLS